MAEESREELLNRLRASGRSVTARQLERWRKAGKVAPPIRRHVRGFRGSISKFPPEAFDQAAAMFDASRQRASSTSGDRRLRYRSFLLWWDGKPVAGDPRAIILNAASSMFAVVERIRNEERTQIVNDPEDKDDPFNIAESYVASHQNEPVRGRIGKKILRNLSRRQEDFLSVVTTMLTTALGGRPLFGGPPVDGEMSLENLILKAIAADHFTKLVAKIAPRTDDAGKESDEDRVRDIFEFLVSTTGAEWLGEQAYDLSDAELEAARRYSHLLMEDIPTVFQALEIIYGKNKFSKTMQILTSLPTDVRAYLVICMGALTRRYGSAPFEAIARSCQSSMGQAKAVCALYKTFPEHRQLLLNRNLNQLAALTQEERDRMYKSVKHLLT